MSKFRRVADIQSPSPIMERTFVGNSVAEEDPYADLRAGNDERRVHIARESMGLEREGSLAEQVQHSWEQKKGAEIYQERRMVAASDSRMSNMRPEDTNARAIRRSDYGTDQGFNARPNPSDNLSDNPFFVTAVDAQALMSRGASIWDPQMETLKMNIEHLVTDVSHENDKSIFDERTARDKAAAKHARWEDEKQEELKRSRGIMTERTRTLSAARANPILRTSYDETYASAFGLPDLDHALAAGKEREAMDNRKREERLAFKKGHVTPEERRRQWENNVQTQAQTRLQMNRSAQTKMGFGDQ